MSDTNPLLAFVLVIKSNMTDEHPRLNQLDSYRGDAALKHRGLEDWTLHAELCVYVCLRWAEAGLVTPAVMATDVPRSHSSTQKAGIQAICTLGSLSPISPALSFTLSKISPPHLYPCHNGCEPQAAELSQTHNHQPAIYTHTLL